MALLNVGIHENLSLSNKTLINDKGTLELAICKGGAMDVLAALENNTTADTMEQSYRFYPPNLKDFDQNLKAPDELLKDLLQMRAAFMEYGKLFATEEEVNAAIGGLMIFEGTGQVDTNAAIASLVRQDYLTKVTTNLATRFVNLLKEHNAFDGKITFRQKLPRQSAAKVYSGLPRFSTYEVYLEPMTVAKADSKIAFSTWEIDNGRDHGRPIASTKAESTPVDEKKASTLFAKPAADAAPDLG